MGAGTELVQKKNEKSSLSGVMMVFPVMKPLNVFLRLQGKLTKTLTKLYDGLVHNLRTILQLICPEKALAKTLLSKPSMVDIATIFNGKFSLRYFE